MMKKAYLIITAAALWATTAFGGSVTAKKDGVEILESAAKGAKVIATLKKGESVESSDRKGMFWQVKTSNGKAGFVSVMAVNRSADGGGNLAKAIQAAAKEGREGAEVANARSRSAVMGVRGLDENEETAFAGNVKPNMRRVYAMEDYKVTPAALNKLGNNVMKEIETRVERDDD